MTEATQINESIWTYKPWWCQPWSILLTGNGIITASWLVFHRYWLTGIVAVPLLAWMGFFLVAFPKLAKESGLLEEMKNTHEKAASDMPNAAD